MKLLNTSWIFLLTNKKKLRNIITWSGSDFLPANTTKITHIDTCLEPKLTHMFEDLSQPPPKKKKGQLGPIGVHPKKKQKKTSPESTVLHMKQGGSLLPPFPCKGGHPQFPHHQPSVRGGCASASPKMVE